MHLKSEIDVVEVELKLLGDSDRASQWKSKGKRKILVKLKWMKSHRIYYSWIPPFENK